MEMLADWCIPLPDAEQMRAVDAWAIEQRGVPSLDLMERAGVGVAAAVERLSADGPVAIVCGKGNNGGDGLVAARLLRERGRPVTVILLGDPQRLRGDARESLARLPGEPPLALLAQPAGESAAALAVADDAGRALGEAAVVVDALLGTGARGKPEGEMARAIEAIGSAAGPVVSVDVPSGVDASSGVVAGVAVEATVTVTFHAAKPGLWITPGKRFAGEVEVVDIGIPRGAPKRARIGLIDGRAVLAELPRRGASSTKFTSGHVVVVGGSVGLSGAPRMAAEAAMRAGAGYVTVCVPGALQPAVAFGRPELMSRAMPEREGALSGDGVEEAMKACARAGALLLGPGIGRSEPACELARELARRAPLPLLLDADGLNAHAGRMEELAGRDAATVLTPHAGELARLLGVQSAEVQGARLESVRAAAAASGAVVVLKGDDTLIAEPGGLVAVSEGDSPALASAGTGDVLGGAIAALMAQGLDALDAAAAGVWLHVIAGRIAAREQGCAEGVLAGDVIAALPRARVGAG